MLYERSLEHLEDAHDRKPAFHIYKHWAISHPELNDMPKFNFRVLTCHKTSMERQLMEAIRISSDGELNSKCEWRQNQIKRISVHLTENELKMVEKELEVENRETQRALDDLNEKLNRISNVKPTNKPSDPLIDNDFQPADINCLIKHGKRKLSKDSASNCKKQRFSEVQVEKTSSALSSSSVCAPVGKLSSKSPDPIRLL